MITESNQPGGKKASTEDIITYLATKAGPQYASVLMLAIDQQISRLLRTNKRPTHIDYEMHVTNVCRTFKKKNRQIYEQTFLYKQVPIVSVEFSTSWTIHKLDLKKHLQ